MIPCFIIPRFDFARRTFLLLLWALLIGGGLTCLASAEEKKIVVLTIQYGDGVEKRFTALPWKEGMTIADALALAQEHPRGIKFKNRGKGATSILLELDGLANGTNDKYWIFDLNGKEGDCSYALVKLQPGDAVLWRFSTYP